MAFRPLSDTMMSMADTQILNQIRQLARQQGVGARRLAQWSGVGQSICYRVLAGESDTWTRHAESMLAALEKNQSGTAKKG